MLHYSIVVTATTEKTKEHEMSDNFKEISTAIAFALSVFIFPTLLFLGLHSGNALLSELCGVIFLFSWPFWGCIPALLVIGLDKLREQEAL